MWASRLANLLKRDPNIGVFLWILQTLRTPISKNICERLVLIVVTYCIENWIKLFSKRIGLPNWPFVSFETWNHSILLTIIRIHLFYHSLSFSVTHCHFFVICCHSLSLAVPLVVTRWITRCHSLYHSISFVVTRCHSLYHLFSIVIIRCHSMSLDVPLFCLFTNDHYFIRFCFLHHL